MFGTLSNFILKIFGWQAINRLESRPGNCIIIVAPHTSLWDFIIGRLSLSAYNLKGKFLIKKKYFRFPFKHLLKWAGGIPVDIEHGSNAAKHAIQIFKDSKDLCLIITPEGTRAYTKHWKKGYYFIAMAAKVPIVMGYVDYREKICCMDNILMPSGDYEKDFKIITDFYRGKVGRHPERFNLS